MRYYFRTDREQAVLLGKQLADYLNLLYDEEADLPSVATICVTIDNPLLAERVVVRSWNSFLIHHESVCDLKRDGPLVTAGARLNESIAFISGASSTDSSGIYVDSIYGTR